MNILGIRMTNVIWSALGVATILLIISGWKILKKAGEKPWKILIPVYGAYCMYRIASSEGIFWGIIAVSSISSVIARTIASNIARNTFYLDKPDLTLVRIIYIVSAVIVIIMHISYVGRLAESFGKGKGFAAGLFFLFPVFALILGFGNDAYYGSNFAQNKISSPIEKWQCARCGTENAQSRETCQNCGAAK